MDRITLRDLRAYGRHGADPQERTTLQPFDLTIELDLDLSRAAAGDDLADTVDYAVLYERVRAIVEQTSYALLERLASEVADATLADPRVRSASVTIAKPGILGGATPSVTLSRSR